MGSCPFSLNWYWSHEKMSHDKQNALESLQLPKTPWSACLPLIQSCLGQSKLWGLTSDWLVTEESQGRRKISLKHAPPYALPRGLKPYFCPQSYCSWPYRIVFGFPPISIGPPLLRPSSWCMGTTNLCQSSVTSHHPQHRIVICGRPAQSPWLSNAYWNLPCLAKGSMWMRLSYFKCRGLSKSGEGTSSE